MQSRVNLKKKGEINMNKRLNLLKKLLIIGVMSALVLVGCSKAESKAPAETPAGAPDAQAELTDKEAAEIASYPNKPINVIVAYGAGGGTDVSARILLPYVEKELGATMNVVNVTGGSGYVGWTQMLNATKDGYTIAYINTPTVITGYLNPEAKRDPQLENFALIANHVVDYGVIGINANDSRFSNLEEFIEYAKVNEVTATTTGLGSDDHISLLKFNKAFGTKILAVHDTGYGTSKASVMGGNIDALYVNIGDILPDHQSGNLKCIGVLAPERSELISDVPTVKEITGVSVVNYASRGIAAQNGVPKEILDKLNKAFLEAMNNPELKEKIKEVGLDMVPMDRKEYKEFLLAEEKSLIELKPLLGWDK